MKCKSFFKPKKIYTTSGNYTLKPISFLPLYILIVLIVIYLSIRITNFSLGKFFSNINQFTVILSAIFKPNLNYFPNVVKPLLDTIKMSILGSVIGSVLALPFAVLASSNINSNKLLLAIIRFLFALIRTFPTLVIAVVASLVFGLGTFAGTCAIAIFTFGIVGKMVYESIETLDLGAFEAMISIGCTKTRAFIAAVLPQILPTYLNHSLYCFETNVRAASILGYVGAGGLGILINERIGWRDYNSLGTALLTLFVTVLLIDLLSTYLRKRLS